MGSASNHRTGQEAPLPYLPSPPIAPEGGSTTGDLTAAMVQRMMSTPPVSGAQKPRALRQAFPDNSLALRVAPLKMVTRPRRRH